MKIEVVDQPDSGLADFFEKRIEEFNVARWDVKHKVPLAVKVCDSTGEILAGGAGKSFGNWLLIDNIWVSEKLRGQNLGSKILEALESAARDRGCKYVLLDTLDFQARPFYEKRGYKLRWVMENYPRVGLKNFMTKDL